MTVSESSIDTFYNVVVPDLNEKQVQALKMIKKFGPGTRMEIHSSKVESTLERILNKDDARIEDEKLNHVIGLADPNHFKPRVRELIDQGLVKVLDDKRTCDFSSHNRKVEVIEITDDGVEFLKKEVEGGDV